MKKTLAVLVMTGLTLACGKKAETPVAVTGAPAAVSQTAAPTPGVPNAPAATPAAAPAGKLSGTIVETMDSGGYTYMKLKTAQGEEWVATPKATVKKGQLVTVGIQMTAEKFQSSTLNRTFDRIIFATLETPVAPGATAAAVPAGGPAATPASMAGAMGSPSDHMKPKVDIGDVSVPKAEGADAKTVAEVWSGRSNLSDKEVVVRGKVVKFLGGIMGTNFMHVRDGSGSEASGDHDLTVTTSEIAAVGDIVTVRGVVHVNKDFGAGYQYPVIVEKATLKK
jgi:hypothetical protein